MDPDITKQRRIYFAAQEDNLGIIKSLVESEPEWTRGQLVNALTEDTTPLIIAVKHGFTPIAHYLVEKCHADLELKGNVELDGGTVITGASPLWCAAEFKRLDLVEYFVRHSADINTAHALGSTALRTVCFDGDLPIVRYLLDKGADMEISNIFQQTCLMVACVKGHKAVVELLLERGANVHQRDYKGSTALLDSAQGGHLEIVKLLMDHGAKLDRDVNGCTPLMSAALRGHKQVVQHFLSLDRYVDGVDPDMSSSDTGVTCLMMASRNGHDDVVKVLVEDHGADIQRRRYDGISALHFTAEYGHLSVVKLLLSYGARMYKDNKGNTPLMRAAYQGRINVVEYLLSPQSGVTLSREEKISALELLGAELVIVRKDHRRAAYYWRRALGERVSDATNVILKNTTPSQTAVYEGATEFRTSEELQVLLTDAPAMGIQGLLIAERILGPIHFKTIHWISAVASTLINSSGYQRGMSFLVYALENSLQCFPFEIPFVEYDLQNADKLLRKIIQANYRQINFDQPIRILKVAVILCDRGVKISKGKSISNWKASADSNNLRDIITAMMHFISILCRILPRLSPDQIAECQTEYEKFLQLNPRGKDDRTPLHYAVSLDEVQEAEEPKVRYFSCLTTLDTLLSFGLVDVNAADDFGDTALHIATRHAALKANLSAQPNPEVIFVRRLISAGADVNAVNNSGHSPFKRFQNSQRLLRLLSSNKCLISERYDKAVNEKNFDFVSSAREIIMPRTCMNEEEFNNVQPQSFYYFITFPPD